MDSNLESAIHTASKAFLNVAEEARKLNNEILQMRAQVERHEDFKQLFYTYYGGQR